MLGFNRWKRVLMRLMYPALHAVPCSSLAVLEELHAAADPRTLTPACQIRDHVWSLWRVRQSGGDHRQLLGGEVVRNSFWLIKLNREVTLPCDGPAVNLAWLKGKKKKDVWPRLSAVCRHTSAHKSGMYSAVAQHQIYQKDWLTDLWMVHTHTSDNNTCVISHQSDKLLHRGAIFYKWVE